VTEKSTQLSEFNKVVFSVPVNATKLEIKTSVEKIFSVKVKAVNTTLLNSDSCVDFSVTNGFNITC
jgi:large subunit ribosomal protein L23